MEKQIEKPTAKQLKEEAMLKDKKRAQQLIKVYSDLATEREKVVEEVATAMKPFMDDFEAKTKPVKELYEDRLTTLTTSMEEAKKELLLIGNKKENKKLFSTDGNWNFDNTLYYLHQKHETVTRLGKEFSLDKFIKRFGEYVDVKFKIADLKKAMTDGDLRPKFEKMHFDLGFNITTELKQRKDKAAQS